MRALQLQRHWPYSCDTTVLQAQPYTAPLAVETAPAHTHTHAHTHAHTHTCKALRLVSRGAQPDG